MAPVRPAPAPPAPPELDDSADADEPVERTVIAPLPASFMADMQPRRQATQPLAPGLTEGDGVQWFMAVEGDQTGPFTRKALVDKLIALPRSADVHVWNEGLDGWKPPAEVPEVQRDLVARRRAPPPPPRPAAPRATPAVPPSPVGAGRGRTQPFAGPLGAGGARLPPPSSPALSLSSQAAAADDSVDIDSSFGETPGPGAPPPRTRKPTNGVHAHGASSHGGAPLAEHRGGESDALSSLDLGGGLGAASSGAAAVAPELNGAGAASPRLLRHSEIMPGWDGAAPEAAHGRHRNAKFIFAFLGVIGAVCVVLLFNVMKKPPPAAAPAPPKSAQTEEPLGALSEKVAQEKTEPAFEGPMPAAGDVPAAKKGPVPKSRFPGRPQRAVAGRGGTAGAAAGATPAEDPNAARLRDNSTVRLPTAVAAPRIVPSQADISRVINNNKGAIKTCYQRALVRDSSLTHGKLTVRISIGISGRVKSIGIDGPPHFRTLEPCIKEMVSRWTFPQSSDEYGSEFPLVFQGNE